MNVLCECYFSRGPEFVVPNEISFGTSFGIECHGFLQNHIRNDDLVCDLVHCKRWPNLDKLIIGEF